KVVQEQVAEAPREQEPGFNESDGDLLAQAAYYDQQQRAQDAAQPSLVVPDPGPTGSKLSRPSDEEIIAAVADRFSTTEQTALAWIMEINLRNASTRLVSNG